MTGIVWHAARPELLPAPGTLEPLRQTVLASGPLRVENSVLAASRPKLLLELTIGRDPEKAKRAFSAMMEMRKIDIATLEAAVA